MMANLQEWIRNSPPGGEIALPRDEWGGECEGPIVIDKPICLDGRGCTVWTSRGPVLTVRTTGRVELKNLHLEVVADPENEIALKVDQCGSLEVRNVRVTGQTQGLSVSVVWAYPRVIALKGCPAEETTSLTIRAPEPFRARWDLTTIGKGEETYKAGRVDIRFPVPRDAKPGDLIRGQIHVLDAAGNGVGTIEAAGWVTASSGDSSRSGTPRESLPVPPSSRWTWRIPIAVAAVALLVFALVRSCKPSARISVKPRHVDYGTLFYDHEGIAKRTAYLNVQAALPEPTNVTLSLTTVCVIDGYWTSAPDRVTYSLRPGNTNIPLPFEMVGLTRSHSMKGSVSLTVSAPKVRVVPWTVSLSARVLPEASTGTSEIPPIRE